MGEMADYIADAWCYWGPGDEDFGVEDDDLFRDPSTMCKYCKKYPLHWKNTDSGWRLFDDEHKQHVCEEFRQHKIRELEIKLKKIMSDGEWLEPPAGYNGPWEREL